MSEFQIVIPEPEERADLLAQADALEVTCKEDADTAGVLVQALAAVKAEIHEAFDPVVQAAHKAHKAAVAARKRYLDPVEAAERELKRRVMAWQRAERERVEAERRAAVEAERARLAAEAESIGIPEEALDDLAVAAEAEAAVPEPEAPEVAGLVVVKRYDAEVVDLRALLRWAVEDETGVGLGLVQINRSALRKLAGAMREALNIPGVRLVVTETARRK